MAPRATKLDAIIKIAMMVLCLVAILAMRHACANGVVNLFNTVAPSPPSSGNSDGGVVPAPPGGAATVPGP